jgi:hypothetical protein
MVEMTTTTKKIREPHIASLAKREERSTEDRISPASAVVVIAVPTPIENISTQIQTSREVRRGGGQADD